MTVGLSLAALAFRAGVGLRRTRLGRLQQTPEMRAGHLRFAKPAVLMLLVGFIGGPISWVWLRGGEPLGTFHGFVGLVVAALFAAAAVVGHRIEKRRTRAYDVHAVLGGLAILFAALATVAGFVLLP
ncbi:MAG: DUF4079 family protein [bacterium]|mgnify:CR=1|jgi:hypothetical protein|nr:hypothetical protein [Deltaproteobacteria bacterium]MBT40612.1 hypothetical protein [Deltaproteobacteria bacterium]MCP4240977.1 DUF4079 family protein [bacterium]